MGCSTCGKSKNNNNAKCNSSNLGDTHCDCIKSWAIPVDVLPPITYATRENVYITPSDQVFMKNYNGDAWLELSIVAPIVNSNGEEE